MASPLSPVLIALGVVVVAAAPATAQFAGPTLSNPNAPQIQKKPGVAEKQARTCPEYGAGYVRLDNGTCVKIGGFVRMQAGSAR
jgi:hypothetical protein